MDSPRDLLAPAGVRGRIRQATGRQVGRRLDRRSRTCLVAVSRPRFQVENAGDRAQTGGEVFGARRRIATAGAAMAGRGRRVLLTASAPVAGNANRVSS